MTKIEFSERENKIVGFLIKGHANSGLYGKDIVCSSISATTLMTLNGLVEVLKLDIDYDIKEGYVKCNISNLLENDINKAQNLLVSFKLILEQISRDYPKNVQFRIRRYEK